MKARDAKTHFPELAAGRRLVQLVLQVRRKTTRSADRRFNYASLGERTGDPGSMQLQQFLHGDRKLPLGLAIKVALALRLQLAVLLTVEQRKTVQLLLAYYRVRKARGVKDGRARAVPGRPRPAAVSS